jgi:hypothetical protein
MNMPYYSLIEGEGVAGPINAVSATTTALLSCMGIVFRNNNCAGLYHYPALALHEALVQGTILNMINDIQPTQVFITAPAVQPDFSPLPGSSQADRNAVSAFLVQHAVGALGAVRWMPDRTRANYEFVNGSFVLNQQSAASETRRSIAMATQRPKPQGRWMGGNTIFYGGIGPEAPRFANAVDDDVLLGVRAATRRNLFG